MQEFFNTDEIYLQVREQILKEIKEEDISQKQWAYLRGISIVVLRRFLNGHTKISTKIFEHYHVLTKYCWTSISRSMEKCPRCKDYTMGIYSPEPISLDYPVEFRASCVFCHKKGSLRKTFEKAVEAWNKNRN